MKQRSGLLSALLLAVSSVVAAQTPAPVQPDRPSGSPREAELAKLITAIEDAYTDRAAVFTRDGRTVIFSSFRDGLPQLYAAPADNPDAPTTRLSRTTERIPGAVVLPDGKTLIYRSDKGADESWSLFRMGLDGTGATELTAGAKMQRDDPVIPEGAPTTAFYSARVLAQAGATASAGSALYSLDLARGSSEKRVWADSVPGFLTDVSRDGKWGLWVQFRSQGDCTEMLLDLAKGTTKAIYPPVGGPKVQIWSARFSADGDRIYLSTDSGSEQALLLLLDRNGKELGRYTEKNPATADLEDIAVAKSGDRIAIGISAGNHSDVRLLDAKTLAPSATVAMPLGTGNIGDFSDDGKRLTASWSTPDSPGEIYAIDAASGKASRLRREPRPSLEGLPRITASIVDVPAFDGLKLPTNLYLPAGVGDKKLPVLVVYHGGPSGSSAIRWSIAARFFTGLGWAVVEPNVRGSGGFGRAFEAADNGPKRLDAFRDVETTARWAASQSWADKNRMVVYGGSYGGYTVLTALEKWPDIWMAGVDLVGVANLTTFLQSTSGIIREIFKVEFGDLEKDAAFLKTISPIEEIDKIRDPLFVYAGANDPRVPRTESDQVVRALRARNVPVEYMVADDEGHSLDRRENTIEFFSRLGVFLETVTAPRN
jgi:dipeptidyl aminopeptidase/acylaminoacyl peptidase